MFAFADSKTVAAVDVRLNVTVSDIGNLTNDGKGTYRTGVDGVAAWLNPTRWAHFSYDICMDWPFSRYPGIGSASAPPLTGTRGRRTLVHRMSDPVPDGGGKSLGVFTGPGGGNDVAVSQPLTATVNSFLDMPIESSLSPDSAEVRFCSDECVDYYSLIFGEKSVFGYEKVSGSGTTKPIITRTSQDKWTIRFPAKTIGRLWKRSGQVTDLGLYYYEGSLALEKQ